jgi:hypothetical protein
MLVRQFLALLIDLRLLIIDVKKSTSALEINADTPKLVPALVTPALAIRLEANPMYRLISTGRVGRIRSTGKCAVPYRRAARLKSFVSGSGDRPDDRAGSRFSKTDRKSGRNQDQTRAIKVHARSTNARHFRSRGEASLQPEPGSHRGFFNRITRAGQVGSFEWRGPDQ